MNNLTAKRKKVYKGKNNNGGSVLAGTPEVFLLFKKSCINLAQVIVERGLSYRGRPIVS